jgi:hypothetical protein
MTAAHDPRDRGAAARRTLSWSGAAAALVGTVWVGCACASWAQAPNPTPAPCAGDCDASGTVTVDEIVRMVQIARGAAPISACPAACCRSEEGCLDTAMAVSVDCIVAAVNNALTGCRAPSEQLRAGVHFEAEREPINLQLIGTGGATPRTDITGLLAAEVRPPWIRLDVGFEDVGCPDSQKTGPLYDPVANAFDYCQLDRRLDEGRATGATPLLIIDYTPSPLADPACAATNGGGLGTERCPPADYAKYGALVEAMIGHVYTAYGVTDFEVWNEPDGIYFAGRFSDYLQIYETSNSALARAEGALGLSPGTLHLGGPAVTLASRSWISRLLAAAVQDPALRVDFISWHNYANSPFVVPPDPNLYAGTYANDTDTVRGWLAPFQTQRSDLTPRLWIDEWNVNAFFDARMDTSYDAAFMAAALHGMQDAGLDRAARFNTWDSRPASPEGSDGNWGLFTNEGRVRPAFHAFALWRRMAPTRVAVELLDEAARARDASVRTRYSQNLVASVDTATQRATLLLYNFVAFSQADAAPPYCGGGREPDLVATLDLYGLPDGAYQLARRQVDCSTAISPVDTATLPASLSPLAFSGQHARLNITVPADAVVLLTLTPAR